MAIIMQWLFSCLVFDDLGYAKTHPDSCKIIPLLLLSAESDKRGIRIIFNNKGVILID